MFSLNIQNAIDANPDQFDRFTEAVDGVRKTLQSEFQIPIVHDKDMNYANSQRLCICLDSEIAPVSRESATCELHVYISSKGKLFAFHFLNRVGTNEWRPIREAELPERLGKKVLQIENELKSLGLERVMETDLRKEVPGHFTEMDGAPATLFDVLFSELR